MLDGGLELLSAVDDKNARCACMVGLTANWLAGGCVTGGRRTQNAVATLKAWPVPSVRLESNQFTATLSCRPCSLAHGAPVAARPEGGMAGGTVTYRYLSLNT